MSMLARLRVAAFALALVATAALPAGATEITRVLSPGGIEAWLVREPSIPMVALEVAWRDAGSKTDPAGREGLANMVSGLLDEGAGEIDSQTFQALLEDNAIGLSFSADRDDFRGSLRTLSEKRDEAFRLLRLALTEPRFDAEPVERIRRQILSRVIGEQEDPGSIAIKALFAAAYPEHPYGRPPTGTVESLPAIEAGDLRGFVAHHLARANMVVGVVGDIDAAELGRLLDATFADLPATPVTSELVPVAPAVRPAPLVIEKAIPQSVVQFAGPGVLRNDPDYYAAYVMNYVLGGGGFNSRLTEEVREKRGLAYSVYSYLLPLQQSALQLGGLGTRNESVAESLKLVRAELVRMREQGLTAEELANAKTYLNGSFPLRLSSNARIANMLVGIQIENLGIDYLDRRAGLIGAVTLEDVQRVAKRLLDPDQLIVVVVGRPVGLNGG